MLTLSLIICLPFVNAELKISEPKSVYSLGDFLIINVFVLEPQNLDGLIKISLVCPFGALDFYTKYIQIEKEKEFNDNVVLKLKDLKGNCKIKAEFLQESSLTKEFLISDNITSEVFLQKTFFKPEEKLIIYGNAIKANQESLGGKVIINFLNSEIENKVKNGYFYTEFEIPKNFAGEGKINLLFFDNFNKGSNQISFYVSSVPSSIVLDLNKYDFNPAEKVEAKAILYDQAYSAISGDLILILKDEKNKELFRRDIKSNDNLEFLIPENTPAGELKLTALFGELKGEKQIFIKEYASINSSIEGNKIIIKNIGNIPYNSTINITFSNMSGEEVIEKNLIINPGDDKEFILMANGTYDISIGNRTFKEISLTGSTLGAVELKNKSYLPLFFGITFFILLLFLIIFLSSEKFRNLFKRKSAGKYAGKYVYVKKLQVQERTKPAHEQKNEKIW